MIAVIIAGGSGTRLWPLSTPDYPKHLLKLTGDKTLLQLAYERAKKTASTVYVFTEKSHAHHVREQIPGLSDETCIVEPARRGTASCIIAGLHYVSQRHGNDEIIAFMGGDHVIRDVDGFAYSFAEAAEASKKFKRITLVGVEPTYPSTGFGYIEKGGQLHDNGLLYKVAGFKEKPEFAVAQDYVRSGRYLWNGNYFVGSVSIFLRDFKEFSPKWVERYDRLVAAKTPQEYENTYLSFDTEAIDYALMELDTNLQVVPASFDWKDLGSFADVHAAVETDAQGNAVIGGQVVLDSVENSFVHNIDGKPLAVIGLDNVVVVNTPNGILVARKDLSQKVKDVAAAFQKRS